MLERKSTPYAFAIHRTNMRSSNKRVHKEPIDARTGMDVEQRHPLYIGKHKSLSKNRLESLGTGAGL